MRPITLPRIKMVKISRKQACFLVLIGLFLLLGISIPENLTVTKTDSVKYHVFWELERRDPAKNDYVRLGLYEPEIGCNPCSIVKRIGCTPGEHLTSEEDRFYCNGEYLGQAKAVKQHPSFDFNGTIPPGMVFLIGDRKTSYDSRYFGFKPFSDIETVLLPLF